MNEKTQMKITLLQGALRTKELVANLDKQLEELKKSLIAEADFKNAHHQFLASAGSDCSEAKRILAELSVSNPGKNQAERDAWLVTQRADNKALNEAITRQREVAFLIDDHRIKVEIAKKRLENTRAVLALRTAQIYFLSGDAEF